MPTAEPPHCARPLLILPTEIIQAIISHFDTGQLAQAMAVSRLFYHLAAPLLYTSLVVVDAEQEPFWGFSAARHVRSALGLGCEGAMGPNISPRPTTSPSIVIPFQVYTRLPTPTSAPISNADPLPHRFSYTKHLTIDTVEDKCDLSPLEMPNLHTVRIVPPGVGDAIVCHKGGEPDDTHKCRLPSHLQPRKLILGGEGTTMMAAGYCPLLGTFRDQLHPRPHVTHIVFYMGDDGEYYGGNFLDTLATRLERISLVVEPRKRLEGGLWYRELDYQLEDEIEGDEESEDPFTFFNDIAVACVADVQTVEVVGMEQIDPRFLGRMWTVETAKKGVRDAVVANLMGTNGEPYEKRRDKWDREQATEKAAEIQFMTRAEFENRERRERRAEGS